LKREKKKGGRLLVDLVKLAKIAISPVLGKGWIMGTGPKTFVSSSEKA
jgi:hypothetical protein